MTYQEEMEPARWATAIGREGGDSWDWRNQRLDLADSSYGKQGKHTMKSAITSNGENRQATVGSNVLEHANNELKQRTARLSVISNTLLVALKLVVGIFSGSISIISEAAHSAVDLLAAAIAFFAVRKSSEPPDQQHAYGHGKFENLSAAIEAFLIVIAAVWIVVEAVYKFQAGESPEYLEYGILIMFISIVVNYWVSQRLFTAAHQTESEALAADALHLRTDVLTSAGVFAGLVAMKITGLVWLDPAIAIVVSVIIFKAGYKMTLKNLWELTDVSLPPAEEAVIREIIISHPEVISFHRLRTRRSGSYRQIDMHILFANNMHLDKAHDICDEIEAQIKAALGLCDVVIHLEPHEVIKEARILE